MKTNEIRIGIYVIDVFNLKKPIERQIDIDDLAMLGNYKNHPLPFKPIPLTEELLLKFGFTKEVFGWKHWNLDLYLHLDNGCFESEQLPMFIYLKYVHSLQNLYWCLCGEELYVNL